MGKKLKNNLITVFAVIIFLASAISVACALLLHETKVDSSVVFGEISPNATDFVLSEESEMKFDAPGSKNEIKLNVKSYAQIPLEYGYAVEIDAAKSSGLEKALYVYINGEYVGTLAELAAHKSKNLFSNNFILPASDNFIDEINDVITVELHNGAQQSWADGKICVVKFTMFAKTIDYGKNIFVNNEHELRLAIDDVNNSGANIKSVRLGKDIALTGDLNIYNGAVIDFIGGKIIAGAHNVVILPNRRGVTKTVKFISSRALYSDNVNASDAVILNAADMAVELGKNARSVGEIITVLRCDAIKAGEILSEYVAEKLYNGISVGEKSEIIGGLGFYIRDGIVDVTASGEGAYTYSEGSVQALPVDSSTVATIKIGNSNIEFIVYPKYANDMPNIDAVIDRELKHIAQISISDVYELTYDIFLPTYIPAYGLSITWSSNNPSILNNSGVCGDNAEGAVVLTAVIKYNRDIITKTYPITVYKQSNQMRFDYLIARIGEKKLSALYDPLTEPDGSFFVLPVVSNAGDADDYRTMYDMNNIGLKTLNYQIDPNNTFLDAIGSNKVVMREATFESYAEVTIRGVFKNEPNKVYEGTIPIDVKLVDNSNLHTAIVEYLQSLLDDTDILGNILATRAAENMSNERGDFTLPGFYKGYDINFSLTDGTDNYEPDPTLSSVKSVENLDGHIVYNFGVNAEKFKNTVHSAEFFVRIKIAVEDEYSLPESIAALYVNMPPAIHNAPDDVQDSSIFYTMKLQMIEQMAGEQGVPLVTASVSAVLSAALAPNYILLYDIVKIKRLDLVYGDNIYNADSEAQILSGNNYWYYEITASSVVGAYKALQLIDVTVMNVVNGSNSELFGNGGDAQFIAFVCERYKDMQSLSLIDCVVDNPYLFTGCRLLNSIDLSSSVLSSFNWINFMSNNNLKILDLSETNYDPTIHSDILAASYYSFVTTHSGKIPNYYYTVNGVKTLYVPMQSDEELKLIFYLYCLSDVDALEHDSLQLVTKIYGVGGDTAIIDWSVAPEDAGIADIAIKTNGSVNSTVLQNLLINAPAPADEAYKTISLTAAISGNGYTALRVFKIKVYYGSN